MDNFGNTLGKLELGLVRERVEAHFNFFSISLSVLSYSMSIVEKKKEHFISVV